MDMIIASPAEVEAGRAYQDNDGRVRLCAHCMRFVPFGEDCMCFLTKDNVLRPWPRTILVDANRVRLLTTMAWSDGVAARMRSFVMSSFIR